MDDNDHPPTQALKNPVIHQFHGAFFFERWGADDIIRAAIDGTPREITYHGDLEYPQNFSTSSYLSSYYLNQTTIDWSHVISRIPTTQNVSYLKFYVNSSEICDWAFVSEETLSNENVTMHRIQSVYHPPGFYRETGIFSEWTGSPHFVREGAFLRIANNFSAWNPFTPHSIFKDLNVTYNYRIELFHEVAGQPELLLSIKTPTIGFQIWDDPVHETGLNRDLTVTAYCYYISIVDVTNNYPSVFSTTNRYSYNLSESFIYH